MKKIIILSIAIFNSFTITMLSAQSGAYLITDPSFSTQAQGGALANAPSLCPKLCQNLSGTWVNQNAQSFTDSNGYEHLQCFCSSLGKSVIRSPNATSPTSAQTYCPFACINHQGWNGNWAAAPLEVLGGYCGCNSN